MLDGIDTARGLKILRDAYALFQQRRNVDARRYLDEIIKSVDVVDQNVKPVKMLKK